MAERRQSVRKISTPNGKGLHRILRGILLLLLSNLLAACQYFPFRFDFEPREQREPEPTVNWVESHRFSIDSGTQMVGRPLIIYTRPGDTLPDIARHFGLGFNDITEANPKVDVWLPEPDSRVTVPLQFILPDTQRQGIVLNLPNMRLFYYPESGKNEALEVFTYPIGIGREGWSTPTGNARITEKRANPSWTVPASILREHAADGDPLPRVVKAGPDNPLGLYALRLSLPSYLIHGTNKPYGVGMRISHGCVRLYPENIEQLFNRVAVGTRVRIIQQPYLLAWHENMLYLEAHRPLESKPGNLARIKKFLLDKISKEAKKTTTPVDFDRVEQALTEAKGIPTPILRHSHSLDRILEQADIVRHPDRFYGAPDIPPITARDWSADAGTYRQRSEAETLAQLLNHQGPPIPSRVRSSTQGYRVILGPFKNRKEADVTQKRIHREFQIDISLIEPTI
ncbi:MAG: L,D-transpeptidase family protein [Gammaproteobacteria bacterium]